ncbi:hypothetical protein K2173_006961 [Erythroxylum novogranatense]|uniref:FAD/NAD(P)-binding oxidoreductase family protein n=1 Tax=Erythroxylum novogranatense TaxID=1862640 RepID=A0AAV8SY75_9ROSI|nr:hypothetical protein K2173_006961 [Erythroxylum novogranatense]
MTSFLLHSVTSFSTLALHQPLKTSIKPSTSSVSSPKIMNIACNSKTDKRRASMDSPKPKSKSKKSSYGTSRKSILKKTFNQEQVVFTAPVLNDPHVGIIGGGMAGLVCALTLEKRGVKSTVFDTGNHGLGGRMGTRVIDPQPLVFDHAAQFFTVSDPQFAELANRWVEKGLIQQWEGTIGKLEMGGLFTPFPTSPPRYIGVNGMRSLADSVLSLSPQVNVVRPCWISEVEAFNGLWHLSENRKPRGRFDVIVIAHNGKCANRLLASSGLPVIARQMKKLELSSIWALLAAFEHPLPLPIPSGGKGFEGALVEGVDSVSWMANNTAKLQLKHGPHCWTFFSTAAYGKRNKVPQENIPIATAEKVKMSMLEGVEAALGLSRGSLEKPFYSRVQLWGAALPTNTPGVPCIFDDKGRAGVCGDWLLGSNMESAALSGMALANHIADYLLQSQRGVREDFGVGLDAQFLPLQAHDSIGQFILQ